MLKVDLIHRALNGDEVTLVSQMLGDANQNVDGGFPGDFDTQLGAPAVAAGCGDSLVLRLKLISGQTPYTDFNPMLTTP